MMDAPVVLWSVMPPVGPSKSLMTITFCNMLCSTRFGSAGTPARARDAGADLRHHKGTHLLARERHARHGPGGWDGTADIRNRHHDAAHLHRVDVVDHAAAVDAVISVGLAHTVTLETEEPVPPRVSVK